MKGFLTLLFVLAVLGAAAWFFYDPYLKPHFEKYRGDEPIQDTSAVAPSQAPAPPAPRADTPPSTAPAPPAVAAPGKTAQPPVVAPKSDLDLALETKYPFPEILPLATIVDNWRNVPEKAYPAEVTAKEVVPFQLVVDGQSIGSTNVPPGTPLKPVRLMGEQLLVSSLANPGMSTQIAVNQTDFKDRIELRYREFVEKRRKEVEDKRERIREMVAADPSRLLLITGKAAPPGPSVAAGADPRIAPVEQALRNGEIESVRFEEAKSFQWNGTEEIGGEFAGTYETVTVLFDVTTIFGTFRVEYKALLKGGKVVIWIDPVTEDRVS